MVNPTHDRNWIFARFLRSVLIGVRLPSCMYDGYRGLLELMFSSDARNIEPQWFLALSWDLRALTSSESETLSSCAKIFKHMQEFA